MLWYGSCQGNIQASGYLHCHGTIDQSSKDLLRRVVCKDLLAWASAQTATAQIPDGWYPTVLQFPLKIMGSQQYTYRQVSVLLLVRFRWMINVNGHERPKNSSHKFGCLRFKVKRFNAREKSASYSSSEAIQCQSITESSRDISISSTMLYHFILTWSSSYFTGSLLPKQPKNVWLRKDTNRHDE